MLYIFLILLSCLSQNLFSSAHEDSKNSLDKATQTLANLTLKDESTSKEVQKDFTPQTKLQQIATKDSMVGSTNVYGDGL